MAISRESTAPRSRTGWVPVAGYIIFGVSWILLGNELVTSIASLVPLSDREIEVGKGLAFVLISAVLIGLLQIMEDRHRRQIEASAQSERIFSDAMLESMPGIVYSYNESGEFLRWNRNFEIVTGYTAAEITSMSPLDFFHANDRHLIANRIAEVFERGGSYVEAPFVSKDGTATPYFLTGKRMELDGAPCLVGMGIDISERRKAEEVQLQLAAIVNSTFDAIIGQSLDGTITSWNVGAIDIFGYQPSEVVGKKASLLCPPDRLAELSDAMERIKHGDHIESIETRRLRKDGSQVDVFITYSPILDPSGKIIGISKIARDITERKRAEAALQELNETLERKVEQRTAELTAALLKAESADRLKSAFLATMSHELRTPLNSIIGFTGIVLQGLAGPLNPEQGKQLGMVRNSANHLLELINDVLDLSKIEADQLEVQSEPFDLRASIEKVAGLIEPMADAKQVDFSRDIAPGVGQMVGDRRRVEQILLNVLNNAIKFTDQGSVALRADRVEAYRPAGSSRPVQAVQIRVKDTGIGIRPEDLQQLFLPFRQVDTGLARQHEGTGLGLVICRRLAALMGGEITVESEWSKGSEFIVTLPTEKCS